RGVTPTPYGDSFISHARSILAQVHQAGQEIDDLATGDAGTATVGTHLAGSNLLLPRAIAAVKQAHPTLTVVVREGTPDTLQTELLTGDIDLTVGRLYPAPPPHLVQERLYREPIRLVARRDHPVHAESRAPALKELSRYPWVFPIAQTALRAELEKAFSQAGAPIPDNRIECTSMLTLRQLLVTTDVIAALPMLIATQDDKLAFLSTRLGSIRRAVGVTRSADRDLSPAGSALLHHLREEATGLTALMKRPAPESAAPGRSRQDMDPS
ncbi:MAG: LysR substrate-binding domain-containing protein, partial [Pseudonocardia sp.]|nr:LysR substrate-binding domain-containing protein [Pseudonocardia sp.]